MPASPGPVATAPDRQPTADRERSGALADPIAVFAVLVTLFAFLVYALTAYRTVAFWDAGEFIATSYTLGIPHQPSTPLYVLIGRLASLVPAGSIAFRVNMLSVVAGALTVLFTYLAVVRLASRMGRRPGQTRGSPGAAGAPAPIVPIIAGIVAALLTTTSSSIWNSAIEAEVYSLSAMMVAMSIWAIVRWADAPPERRDTHTILVVFYLLSLSIAIHLGTFLVLPGLLVLVVRERPPWLLERRDLVLWFVGLPVLAGILVLAARSRELGPASGAGAFLIAYLVLLPAARDRRLAAALLVLLGIGVSVHLFLPIRAHLDPVINEGDPDNWRSFWNTLTRAQYPATNIFVRRAPLFFQFDHMFFRYLREQWPLVGRLLLLPILLALWGGARQSKQDRSGFWMMLLFVLITGPVMVIYLNFTDHEVRERDYFFGLSFQAVAMWAGLGAGALAELVAGRLRKATGERPAAAGRSLLLAGLPLVLILGVPPLIGGWHEHDRSNDWIARDYAYNLLVPLPRDAILFTNGDNDTFPLWYLQEIEGIRKDVRVVNLSLLNTPWYIKQLRDQSPEVPILWSDREIDGMRLFMHPEEGLITAFADGRSYEPGTVKDVTVRHILNNAPPGRPLYLAVTVPDRMGLEERLTMEGLAQRIHPEPTLVRIDVETCRRNAYEIFTPLRGILTEGGETDRSFPKTENQSRLVQNYAAIHFYMAVTYDGRGQLDEAVAEAERAQAISPGFSGNRLFLGMLYEKRGDLAAAEAHYRQSLEEDPGDERITHRLGRIIAEQGRPDEAVPLLIEAMEKGGPGYFDPYVTLFEVYARTGQMRSALSVLDRWLARHPDDQEVREIRDRAARGELFDYGPGDSAAPGTPAGGAARPGTDEPARPAPSPGG